MAGRLRAAARRRAEDRGAACWTRSPARASRGRAAGCCSTAPASSSAAIAAALGGEVAGDPRRWRDSCERLAVVCAAPDPRPVLARFAELPQIVARGRARRAPRGRRHRRGRAGRARRRRAGAVRNRARARDGRGRRTSPRSARCPTRPTRRRSTAALGLPWCPPELREAPFRGEPPALVELDDIRGDLHCHTTWSDGRASVEEMGRAARDRGYEYLAICDHTPAVGAVRGLDADDVRRQAEEIAAANAALAPFRVLRGIECDILPDGRLDLPDDVLAELDWVQASVHGGQRMPARQMTDRVLEALRNPYVRCLSHPTGATSTAGPRTRSTSTACSRSRSSTASHSRSTGFRSGSTCSAEHVRDAIRAGRADRLLDGRALPAAREHGVRGRDRPPRRGDRRRRPQHPPAARAARALACLLRWRRSSCTATRSAIPRSGTRSRWRSSTRCSWRRDGRAPVLTSSLEAARIAGALPDAELCRRGARVLRARGGGHAARRGGARDGGAGGAAVGHRDAVVPADLPVAVADRLRGGGRRRRRRRSTPSRRAAASKTPRRARPASAARSARPRRAWPPPRR